MRTDMIRSPIRMAALSLMNFRKGRAMDLLLPVTAIFSLCILYSLRRVGHDFFLGCLPVIQVPPDRAGAYDQHPV